MNIHNSQGIDIGDVVKTILDTYAYKLDLVIGLYDYPAQDIILPNRFSGRHKGYCEYCSILSRTDQASGLCLEDQLHRGKHSVQPGFEACHAGLWTYNLPIEVDGTRMATLIAGKLRLSDQPNKELSEFRRDAVATKLHMNEDERKQFFEAFSRVKLISQSQAEAQFLPALSEAQKQISQIYGMNSELKKQQQAMLEEGQRFGMNVLNISHEFKIRLQGLIAFAEELVTSIKDPSLNMDNVEEAQEVLREAWKLNILVLNLGQEQLLGDYEFRDYDIAGILSDSAELYRAEARRKNVEIRTFLDPSHMWLFVSRDHLRHALNNMIQNAVKYAHKGAAGCPRWIDVTGRKDGAGYQVTIENYGVGILPHEFAKIFLPGYRGELTKDEKRTGSGLGLYVTKQIIDRHQGSIQVRSTKSGAGHVNRFTVNLPGM